MPLHLVTTWVHIVLGITLVGYALFWTVLALAVPRSRTGPEGKRPGVADAEPAGLLESVHRTPWPPRGLPVPVRVPMWVLGWLLFLAVVGSGIAVHGPSWVHAAMQEPLVLPSVRAKIYAVGLALLFLLTLSPAPRRAQIVCFFLTLLFVVGLSGVLAR